jgi:protein-tyrosine phosphatase
VRWRALFRSDHLGGLTADDRATLAGLGLARAFDFRGEVERAARPYELPGVVQHPLPIEPVVVQRMQDLVAAGHTLTGPLVERLMQDLYRALVNDQSHRFAELFEHLLAGDGNAVLHCTAGKDRTGFAVALILLALGVSREQVLQDYLLTNEVYPPPPMPRSETPAEALAVLWRVQQEFLDAALHAVDTDHGGIDRYLHQRLGLTDAARSELAARFLAAG